MADQVNIDLLGQAYCNVMTRKTGIKHTYTIKGKDDKKQNEKMYRNLNRLTYGLYIFGVGLLIGTKADGKILLTYALILMTYNLVVELCSFNSWIADNAGEHYKRKQNREVK